MNLILKTISKDDFVFYVWLFRFASVRSQYGVHARHQSVPLRKVCGRCDRYFPRWTNAYTQCLPPFSIHITSTSQSYGVSLAIEDHTVLPVTWHKWTHPALTPVRQAGTRFTYPGGTKGWVYLGDWLHTEMVYVSVDSHPSK